MHVLPVRNVHQALVEGICAIKSSGVPRESRNGKVLVMPGPVTTVFQRPQERVLFWADRDANPFFHLYECLWMMCGRNDVKGVAAYVPRMKTFSDDGEMLWGAYGWRWRSYFGFDQLRVAVEALRKNPDDRRVVVSMWDGKEDLIKGQRGCKDVPCNTQLFLSVSHNGAVDMTVCNRSNDMIWGAYGANAVHFSFLQEYVALALGRAVGRYWQVSNNFHAYEDTYQPLQHLGMVHDWDYACPYTARQVAPLPLNIDGVDATTFLEDCALLANEGVYVGLRSQWMRQVAVPMLKAHQHFKTLKASEAKYVQTLEILDQVQATDWQRAGREWVNRRYVKWQKAQNDGPDYNQ